MRVCQDGVTRLVILIGPWAVKVPRGGRFVRGWIANESEWHQRRRLGVNPPLATLGYFASLYRRADEDGNRNKELWDAYEAGGHDDGIMADERKPDSWGRFGDRWLLIDFDRAWSRPRSLVGWAYYANQERLGRRWARLETRVEELG